MANKATMTEDLLKANPNLSKKEAESNVETVLNSIRTAYLEGDTLRVIGLGTFEVKERAARKGRNPQTGEEIDIPASKVPGFKPSKTLKKQLNS